MYPSNGFQDYLQRLHALIDKQTDQLEQLSRRVNQLEDKLNTPTPAPPPGTNIEKIEYHFDQLKIETLEGTLNIGLTPSDGAAGTGIEQLSIQEQPFPPKANTADMVKQNLVNGLNQYLTDQGPREIQQLSREFGQPFDHDYEQKLLDDIRKQLDARVQHYMAKANVQNGMLGDDDRDDVLNQIKDEVRHSLREFMNRHYGKGAD
ncbi:hypothetical protein N781_15065 [Pontibacillus halophilus JSM 076056 = DSM 19796]|uniref:Spore germination protein GerPC n=1 Tax=Pontibacillus halophilus JSM 076056 = DSM 19796 TaxID=1385510 RepID=A0A0A5IAC5_9BACI|nr:spore germination protein GerPC [Pontibacillus halophilus]KGX92787.1 hypothetical protein N781_15065 [Pontibacillus halophilus JSM 076056 = DSM 19796]